MLLVCNKNNVPHSVAHSLVAHPPCAPYQSLRSEVLLSHSFLRSPHNFCFQESIATGALAPFRHITRIPSPSGSNQFVAPPARSSPSVGPSVLRPSWPRPPGPSLRALSVSIRAHQTRFHRTALRNRRLIRFPSSFRPTVSTQPLATESANPIFSNCLEDSRWPQKAWVPSAPAGPPPPKPLTPRIPCKRYRH